MIKERKQNKNAGIFLQMKQKIDDNELNETVRILWKFKKGIGILEFEILVGVIAALFDK